MIYTISLAVIATFLAITNLYLLSKLRAARKRPAPTLDARQLLHDLTSNSGALIKLVVLDPDGLFLMRGKS